MKIVVNKCYGGFSLSPRGVKRYAELKGRKCFIYKSDYHDGIHRLIPLDAKKLDNHMLFFVAYDIPDADQRFGEAWDKKFKYSGMSVREKMNRECNAHSIEIRPSDRSDPDLVKVVEELGDVANGSCAELAITEVPDDVEWTIEEYDGREWVAEKHRTW